MSVELIINGTSYFYPETGDQDWGPEATDWAVAVTSGMLQKAGGLFQLLAETDFGSAYGIKSLYFKSRDASPASAGALRLGLSDVIAWRNNADDGDLPLSVGSSDELLFKGTPVGVVVTVSDTPSIDLTLAGVDVSADLNLSAASASAGYIKASQNIASDGLLSQVPILIGDGGSGGSAGVVPAPATGDAAKFLKGDATWATVPAITSLNGLTTAVQTFATGTSGTDFAINSATSTHTFNLPIASGTNTGKLSNTDWTTFNNKQAAGNYITALTGDVTASGPGSVAATIANAAVTNAKLANMANGTFKARITSGTGVPEDITGTQATTLLDDFVGDSGSGGTKGLVPAPASGDGSTKFLKADGTWDVPPGGAGGISSINGQTDAAQLLTVGTTGTDFNIDQSGSDTNVFNLPVASGTNTGKLSNTDWTTFNNKLSAAVTSINGETGAAQTLQVGSAGTNFAIVTTTNTQTFNLPTASATNTGKLSNTDWSTFNGKQAAGNYITALTGDVTASGPGSVAATIANSAVTNAKMADMTQATIKGRAAGAGTGAPVDLTATQATAILNAFVGDSGSGGTKGLVPAPASGDSSKFLKGDGTWGSVSSLAGRLLNVIVVDNAASPYTYNKNSSASFIEVEVIGGGGSGGGCASTTTANSSGSGGGGGGYSYKKIANASVGTTETVTVGAGGGAATAGNNNGNAGGTTSFGSHCQATGGAAGSGGASGGSNSAGGDGGVGSSGDINLSGGKGGGARSNLDPSNSTVPTPYGGGSKLAQISSAVFNGAGVALNYGGGSAGAQNGTSQSARASAAGAPGLCIIREYS